MTTVIQCTSICSSTIKTAQSSYRRKRLYSTQPAICPRVALVVTLISWPWKENLSAFASCLQNDVKLANICSTGWWDIFKTCFISALSAVKPQITRSFVRFCFVLFFHFYYPVLGQMGEKNKQRQPPVPSSANYWFMLKMQAYVVIEICCLEAMGAYPYGAKRQSEILISKRKLILLIV